MLNVARSTGRRAYGWLRLPAPVRSEAEEPLPVRAPDSGVGGVRLVSAGVLPAGGVAVGLEVGRSDRVPGVPGPDPGAAGVPGFALVPVLEALREGTVVREAGVRFKAACAAAV